MTAIEWSALTAACAFIVLVSGLLLGMRAALARISAMQAAAEALQQDMRAVTASLKGLAAEAEQTIHTAHEQLQSANRLFDAARQIGDSIEFTTSAVKRVTGVLAQSAEHHAERAATKRHTLEAFEWAEVGMAAWQLWQTNRKRHNEADQAQKGEGYHKNEGSE